MSKQNGFNKAIGAVVVAGVITLSTLTGGGSAFAEGGEKGGTEDINIGVGELQEATMSKGSDVDGRDFLVWQRGGSPSAQPTEEVAFYYNKIAFQYAK